ncbi:MAG: tetraacyldisaccharide 4'-kinase [Planctomycetota bacterium]
MNERLHRLRPILEEGAGGLRGVLLRTALWPFGLAMACALRLRRRAYRAGWLPSRRAGVPVLSIGNLTAGGTGKTPMAAYLARYLLSQGRSPAVVARGYGAGGGAANDEERLLRQRVPGLRYEARPDRNAAIDRAVRAGADVILLDDAFQRLQTHRDLDLVLIDATRPFGNGRVLPAGILREPLSALRDADLVVLTHTDQAEKESIERLKKRIARHAPQAPLLWSIHDPARLSSLHDGAPLPLEKLRGLPVAALSTIAKPAHLAATLERLGARVAMRIDLPDHYAYTIDDLRSACDVAVCAEAEVVLTTEKDAVKLEGLFAQFDASLPFFALGVDLRITRGEETLHRVLGAVLHPQKAKESGSKSGSKGPPSQPS